LLVRRIIKTVAPFKQRQVKLDFGDQKIAVNQ